MDKIFILAKRMLPTLKDDTIGFIVWNHTAYPFGSLLYQARQLRQWKKINDAGKSECTICGSAYDAKGEGIELGGMCGHCPI